MEQSQGKVLNDYSNQSDEEQLMDLRRGPWTVEEDFTLINYIAHHGEGRWNSLARCAGLKRTGKSCRLRWLNYLRPDVRRGNITLEEQLLILELHSRWGNRWSKIAQHLPGRTDNEIKNYWRTRVQKHAKQLKCDVNSKQFKDTMRYLWMPRLVERIQAAAAAAGGAPVASTSTTNNSTATNHGNIHGSNTNFDNAAPAKIVLPPPQNVNGFNTYTPENSSDSFGTPLSDLTESYNNYPINQGNNNNNQQDYYPGNNQLSSYGGGDHHHHHQCLTSPSGYFNQGMEFMDQQNSQWMDGGDVTASLWGVDDMWFLQQQFNSNV